MRPPPRALLALLALLAGCGRDEARREVSFRVLTPEGEFLGLGLPFGDRSVRAVARARDGEVRRLAISQDEDTGPLRVSGLVEGDEPFLWVPGCRDLAIPVAAASAPLRLEYGPRVRLRVRADLPPPPLELRLECQWRGPGDAPDALLRHEFPPTAPEGTPQDPDAAEDPPVFVTSERPEVLLRFSQPGRYRLRWTLERVRRSEFGFTSSGASPADAGLSFEVGGRAEEETIEVRIDPVSLKDALGSLGDGG